MDGRVTGDRGPWMPMVRSGLKFYPLDPRPEEIEIADIARGVAREYRFGNQSDISVAQHSIWVSDRCPDEFKLAGLLHDASEGYLGDIPRLLKQHEGMAFYRACEDRIMVVVANKFGFRWPLEPVVHEADMDVCDAEKRLLKLPFMTQRPPKFSLFGERLWGPDEAEERFVERFGMLAK